jgi:hypothetical protein
MTPYVCSGPLYNSANSFDDDTTDDDNDTIIDLDKFTASIQTCCGGYANVILATSITRLEHGKYI